MHLRPKSKDEDDQYDDYGSEDPASVSMPRAIAVVVSIVIIAVTVSSLCQLRPNLIHEWSHLFLMVRDRVRCDVKFSGRFFYFFLVY